MVPLLFECKPTTRALRRKIMDEETILEAFDESMEIREAVIDGIFDTVERDTRAAIVDKYSRTLSNAQLAEIAFIYFFDSAAACDVGGIRRAFTARFPEFAPYLEGL
jgi:hypothetical protein